VETHSHLYFVKERLRSTSGISLFSSSRLDYSIKFRDFLPPLKLLFNFYAILFSYSITELFCDVVLLGNATGEVYAYFR
jgi:hypothetical protein